MSHSKFFTGKGSQLHRVELDERAVTQDEPTLDLLVLNDAISDFEHVEPENVELVRLRLSGGLTTDEAAEALGISRATATRY